jgi:hypothetical protein
LYHKKHLRLFSISIIQLEYNDFRMLLFVRPFVLWNQYFLLKEWTPEYLNCVTCMIWSPTFISNVELLRLFLNLHYIYYVLLLLKRKSYASKICLQVFNISFYSSLDSPIKTTSSTKIKHLGASYWMCFVNTSKTNVNR